MDINSIKAEIATLTEEAINSWFTEWSKNYLRNIDHSLNAAMQANMFRVLGFEPGYRNREWRVDHCNGRKSPVSEFLVKRARQQVDRFLEQLLPHIPEEPTPEVIAAAKKDYDEQFRRALRESIRNKAQQAAQNYAQRLAEELGFGELPLPDVVAIADAEERLDNEEQG